MKRNIIISTGLILIGAIAYAGIRCTFCKGTGFQSGTDFTCPFCKGKGWS